MTGIQHKNSKLSLLGLIVLVLALLGVVLAITFFKKESNNFSAGDWIGTWEIDYYYQNADTLVYTGTLEISQTDSIKALLTINLPQGNRTEQPIVRELLMSNEYERLNGYLIHNRYKIKGGYLQEYFEFTLTQANEFSGKGWCQAYCAEGTAQQVIIWKGRK